MKVSEQCIVSDYTVNYNSVSIQWIHLVRDSLGPPILVYNCYYYSSIQGNKESIVVGYNVLANSAQSLAFFLPEAPFEMLQIFDEVRIMGCG